MHEDALLSGKDTEPSSSPRSNCSALKMPKEDLNNINDAVDTHNEDTSSAIQQIKIEPEQRPRQDSEQVFTPPNGGLEAWLLVLALFLIFANTW